ncbi:MAG TPA: prephenate dehydratase [Gammaproteobacteria bacterium]|nr:prephenate dehydratase [Gammaproteobacteria bacterium]
MANKDPLAEIRKRIDEIDRAIQELVSERAQCAAKVAEVKQQQGETGHFYRPEREAQVLRAVMERNKGPLSDESIAGVFRQIMAACLALEKPLSVAFLGPEGTYTHAAACKHFGNLIESHSVSSIEEVFRLVEAGGANFGVVPVENSTEGVVNHTLDLMMNSSLTISGEVELRIRHNLLSREKSLADVERVYAHQQSIAQCRLWLDRNLPNAERIAVNSNAEAVLIARDHEQSAAIAGTMAAELYDMPILNPDIEDEPHNTTRFVIIGDYQAPPSGSDRTSLLVFAHNRPGSLFDLLKPLATRNISMSNIESRPSRSGVWEYVFFIDIDGHKDEAQVAEAITEIEQSSAMVRVLGSYPKAVI